MRRVRSGPDALLQQRYHQDRAWCRRYDGVANTSGHQAFVAREMPRAHDDEIARRRLSDADDLLGDAAPLADGTTRDLVLLCLRRRLLQNTVARRFNLFTHLGIGWVNFRCLKLRIIFQDMSNQQVLV
jgi:glutathione S-transferase